MCVRVCLSATPARCGAPVVVVSRKRSFDVHTTILRRTVDGSCDVSVFPPDHIFIRLASMCHTHTHPLPHATTALIRPFYYRLNGTTVYGARAHDLLVEFVRRRRRVFVRSVYANNSQSAIVVAVDP